MTLTQPNRSSYRWLFIALTTLAGAYAWYGVTQYQRLNDLRQRQLADVAVELTTTLETALRTLNEFDGKWRRWQTGMQEPLVCDFDTAQPYLEVDRCSAGETIKWSSDTHIAFVTSPALGFKASRAGASDIYFRFRADTLLRELAFPDAFPLIFIATGDKGIVLYQEAPARRQWLRRLRWGEQAFRDANADRPAPVQVHTLSNMVPSAAGEWTRLRAASSRVSVSLGGSYHQLYLHPIVLDEGERQELVVGAAMPTFDILREALALETNLLGVLVFLLLLCVLGFPFVKLLFLDAHERFRLRDVSLLYVSTAALLVLFTSAALAADGYVRWSAEANEGLTALARRLEARFLDEVAAVRDEVDRYDRTVSQLRMVACKSWPVQTRWLDVKSASGADGEAFALPLPTRHVFIRQVAWIGPTGQQLWKATGQATPGKTNVGERPYFRAIRDENLFTIRGDGEPFFLGPDRSITDGKFYTYISLRSRVPPALCDELKDLDGPAVTAATTQLLSLDRQPLPAGYGFALISREGRVLYHSDRRLSLRENLFDEMSRGRRAHNLVFEGRGGPMSSRYREQPHEFYFHPVQIFREADGGAAGFYLATFRDTSADRALLGWVFARGVAGPTTVLVVVCALAALGIVAVSRRTGRGWWAWLWPHGALNAVYKRQTIALVAILLASLAAFLANALAAVFAAAATAVLAFVGIYLYGRPRDNVREPLVRAGWHTASIVLALACVVVAPTAAVFQQALNRTFGDRIVAERVLLEQQKADVLSAAETEALAEYHARARKDIRVADREAYAICVPAPFDAADNWNGPGTDRATRAVTRLAGCQSPHREPVSSVTDVKVASSDVPESIGTAGSVGNARRPRLPFEYSPPGTFVAALPVSVVGALACGLMLALSAGWVRWNTRRVFFADVAAGSVGDSRPVADVWTTLTQDQQMVLLQVAHERVANPYQRQLVDSLLKTGILRLAPDLGPPAEAAGFLNEEEHRRAADLRAWERVNAGHSWRYARVILLVSVVALALFLFATQPGLQTSLLAIATGITGVLTTVLKTRDAITSWFAARKGE